MLGRTALERKLDGVEENRGLTLVEAAVSPAEQIDQLYRDARNDVYGYLLTLGLPPAHAQDLAQETFFRLYRELRNGATIRNPRAWVFRVAHNLGLTAREREGRLEPVDAARLMARTDLEADPEKLALAREQAAGIRQALDRLSPQQRRCLYLRAEGLRYHEIADVVGVSVSTVGEFLRRALAKLKKVVHE
jgi:RNA polymerase sigma-70 factor (ECF subfamily)